jgi:hypothetical protein
MPIAMAIIFACFVGSTILFAYNALSNTDKTLKVTPWEWIVSGFLTILLCIILLILIDPIVAILSAITLLCILLGHRYLIYYLASRYATGKLIERFMIVYLIAGVSGATVLWYFTTFVSL